MLRHPTRRTRAPVTTCIPLRSLRLMYERARFVGITRLRPHDTWGYDVTAPPVLFDFQSGGKNVHAVAQASKSGWLYVFDRATGEPLGRSDPFVPQNAMIFSPSDTRRHYSGTGRRRWRQLAADLIQPAHTVAIRVRYTLPNPLQARGRQERPDAGSRWTSRRLRAEWNVQRH